MTNRAFSISVAATEAPNWITAANLGAIYPDASINLPLVAVDPQGMTVTYQADSNNTVMGYSLPAGLSFNAANGTIYGTIANPSTTGTFYFIVDATNGVVTNARTFYAETVHISPPSFVTSAGSLGTFNSNTAVLVDIQATDPQNDAITFAIISGSLPSGLTATANGYNYIISGTTAKLSTSNTASFTVTATNGIATGTSTFSITVNAVPAPTWVTPTGSLGTVLGGMYFANTVTATDPGYTVTYSLFSGTLPTGLSLYANGTISGTTTGPASNTTSSFTIEATNGTTYSTQNFSITVDAAVPPTWVTSSNLGTLYTAETYSVTLTATDNNGLPVTYGLTSGTLPNGLALSNTGVISGTISNTAIIGVDTFVVTAADAVSNAAQTFTVNVAAFIQTSVLYGVSGQTLSEAIPVTSNTSGTYSIFSGSLPTGLILHTNGVITGTMPTVTTNTAVLLSNVTVEVATNTFTFTQTLPFYGTNDPYAANVVAELHFEGTNGSTTFTDTKGHLVTVATGSPIISTNYSYAGNSSAYLGNASIEIISNNYGEFWFSNNDFTLEAAFLLTQLSGNLGIIGHNNAAGTSYQYEWYLTSTQMHFLTYPSSSASPYQTITFNYTFLTGTWYKLAVSKVGGTIYGFVNGNLIGSSSFSYPSTGSLNYVTAPVLIGALSSAYISGYIDEVRITNGQGRYTTSYSVTPAGVPMPDSTEGIFSSALYYAANSGQSVSLATPFAANNASTYAYTGSLPTGLAFHSNGVITGTMPVVNTTSLLSNISVSISDSSPLPVIKPIPIYSLADPYQANVVAMYHFQGSNGSTVFYDTISGTNAVAYTGTPYISTQLASPYGGSSIYFNGSSGIQMSNVATYNLGSSNFTIEFAMNFSSNPNSAPLGQTGGISSGNEGWYVYINQNELKFQYAPSSSPGNNDNITMGTFPYQTYNTWIQVAVVRSGQTLYGFIDGNLIGSGNFASASTAINPSTANFQMGSLVNIGSTSYTGFLAEFRMTIGVARYTSSYTPLLLPFPN